MARIGWPVLNKGKWKGKEIIPANWIEKSIKISVHNDEMNDRKGNGIHYGYYWWLPNRDRALWKDSFLAAGNYGQYILGIPKLDMVIVHRRAVSDTFAINRNLGTDKTNPTKVTMEDLLELINLIIDAKVNQEN